MFQFFSFQPDILNVDSRDVRRSLASLIIMSMRAWEHDDVVLGGSHLW